jgi:hypothetical protein
LDGGTAVISDHDRDALSGIEAELTRTDPAFAARMRPERALGTFPVIFTLCALFYIGAPLAAMLFGWTGLIVTGVGLGVGVAAVVIRRRPG